MKNFMEALKIIVNGEKYMRKNIILNNKKRIDFFNFGGGANNCGQNLSKTENKKINDTKKTDTRFIASV